MERERAEGEGATRGEREDVRPLTEAVPDSWTLLHIASQYGNLEAVRILI